MRYSVCVCVIEAFIVTRTSVVCQLSLHEYEYFLGLVVFFTIMLVIRTKVNNKYIRPKYGLGIFSKYTPVVRNTERGSVKNNDGKITIDRAIAKAESDKRKQVIKNISNTPPSSKIGRKRKKATEKKILIKKTTSNVKKPRKNVAKAKHSTTDWGDSKLNDLLENS